MKKLNLNRETVRKLDENLLARVQGASGFGNSCNPGICAHPLTGDICPETDLCPTLTRIC